jgi:hypothetical protein
MVGFLALLALVTTGPTQAEGPMVSKTFEVAASAEEITRHAVGCINQHATSGFLDVPTIQSSDPALGVVVATNYLSREGWRAVSRDTRSTLRLDAREGRFRFSNADFLGFSEWSLAWSPLSRSGGRWDRVRERLDEQAEAMADCIQRGIGDNDW